MATHWVIDFETLKSCTVLCAEHYLEDTKRVFVVSKLRNDFEQLQSFLIECRDNESWHVSFNGLQFDAQISEFILREEFLFTYSGEEIARYIYAKAQDVIQRSQRREWQQYPEWELSIKQVDVFALAHWSNPSKMSSLKWIQCSINWYSVQDMPIHHTQEINTQEELDMVISYCQNDVSSTKRIMQLAKEQINLRAQLTKEYGINLYSASEPKMSRDLLLHFLSKKMGVKKWDLKNVNTVRDRIDVEKLIVPYLNFERQEFKMLLNNFKTLVINGTQLRGAFKYSVKYRGIKLSYGVGGLHSEAKPGVFESKDGNIIITSDVSSYYPNLAIKNKWAPAHIPKEVFCEQYEGLYNERQKYPKGSAKNYVLKILLNSVFGLSIEPNSFLSDSAFGVAITINGQLLLSMLLEMICEAIPEAQPLAANTDGVDIMIPEHQKGKYLEVCEKWEKITQLTLEHDQYAKLCSFDCNNFIAKTITGKTKCKGRFEFEPHDKYELNVLHKNKSFLVIPKTIYEYFINGTAPEEYLATNRNIFDYCGFVRAKGAWQLTKFSTGKDGITTEVLQKTLRYYISKKGNKIIKINKNDKREISIEAGKAMCTVFNLYEEKLWEEYNIDTKYYLDHIYKEIQIVEPKLKQHKLELF